MGAAWLNAGATQTAVGSLEAQKVVAGLQAGTLTPDHVWLAFVELQAKHGKASPACRAYVLELVKRVAR